MSSPIEVEDTTMDAPRADGSGTTPSPTPPHAAGPSPLRRRLLIGGAAVGVMLGGLFVARTVVDSVRPHLYSGTVLQGDTPAPPMDGLYLVDGSEVDLAAWNDDVVLVYFGYTFCPDVCPTTLADAARAIAELDEDAQANTRLLMVSVDPERDTLQALTDYTQSFHDSFVGATGARDAIDEASSRYGIYYAIGDGTIEEGYTVDHTASLMVIDRDGVLRLIWPPDTSAEAMAADLAELHS